MAREPYDAFIQEFLQHPGWEYIIEKLDSLKRDFVHMTMIGSKDQFEHNRGKVEGVMEVRSLLLGLIKHAKG